MTELWPPILALIGVVIVGYLTYLASRKNKRSDASQAMIDQHQEDIKDLRNERVLDSQRIARLERIVRIQGDYIGALRRHIADDGGPPPPPWPAGLIT